MRDSAVGAADPESGAESGVTVAIEELIDVARDGDGHRIESRAGRALSASSLVVLGVAAIDGTPPEELSPRLTDVVDPDVVDALFESAGPVATGSLTFDAWDCRVTVQPDDSVHVVPRT